MRLLAIFFLAFAFPAGAATLPDANEIIARVQKRLEKLHDAPNPNPATYTRTNYIVQLDSDGKTNKTTQKIYRVQLVKGLPRARLVAIDGKELSEAEQRNVTAQEERFQRAIAQEKNPDYVKPKAWLTDDIRDRFVFTTTGRTNSNGRSLYMLTFAPRPDAPAKSMIDKVINTIHGGVWVDEEESEIARLDLLMTKPVKFWGGIVGQLDAFDFTIHRARSAAGVWFNRQGLGNIRFRKLWSSMRLQIQENSSDLN